MKQCPFEFIKHRGFQIREFKFSFIGDSICESIGWMTIRLAVRAERVIIPPTQSTGEDPGVTQAGLQREACAEK